MKICDICVTNRWKTTNVDVDKKGRPCKERLLQILSRQSVNNGEGVLAGVVQERCYGSNQDSQVGKSSCFTFKMVEKLFDCFSTTKLEPIMLQLFPS